MGITAENSPINFYKWSQLESLVEIGIEIFGTNKVPQRW